MRYRLSLLSVLFASLLSACIADAELSSAERSLLLTEADLVAYGIEGGKQPAGKFERVRYFDFSAEYSYEFTGEGFYLHSSVAVERSKTDAVTSRLANQAGAVIGFESAGITQQSVKLSKLADVTTSLSLLMMDGKPVGNSFHTVIDKKVVLFIFSGLYFDNEADFLEFATPKLDYIRHYSPSKG